MSCVFELSFTLLFAVDSIIFIPSADFPSHYSRIMEPTSIMLTSTMPGITISYIAIMTTTSALPTCSDFIIIIMLMLHHD